MFGMKAIHCGVLVMTLGSASVAHTQVVSRPSAKHESSKERFVGALAQTSSTDPHSGQITVTPPVSQKVIAGSPNRFTGSVRVRSLFDAKSPARSPGGEMTFQPGARSAWHTHPLGQVLIVTDGVGWLQQWGSPLAVKWMEKVTDEQYKLGK
jgi:hypothetical protein